MSQFNIDEIEKRTLSGLKDFQRATVERVDYLFRHNQNRVLVADEVGMGKTLIARGAIVKTARLRIEEKDDLFKVIYIGIWGQRHLDYLKQYRKVTYTNLLTSGRLNAYLADINRQAQERFERLIEGMKQAQGITEQLKAENALEWTGCLNNIRACAREIVEKEIIFA